MTIYICTNAIMRATIGKAGNRMQTSGFNGCRLGQALSLNIELDSKHEQARWTTRARV